MWVGLHAPVGERIGADMGGVMSERRTLPPCHEPPGR